MNPFGPIFWFDLVRLARRGGFFRWRCLYGLALLGILYVVYASNVTFIDGYVPPTQITQFAFAFCVTFLAIQFLAVSLIMPLYAGEAILEERQRNTLDCLLITQLRERDVVIGKLAARWAQLSLVLLTGMPILSFVQLLGGVDPWLIWGGFGLTLVAMWQVGALGMSYATWEYEPRLPLRVYLVAVFLSYFVNPQFSPLDETRPLLWT